MATAARNGHFAICQTSTAASPTPMIGPADALLAVERVLVHEHFDEVIVSTLPERVSQWLKRDLPSRIERLELPVTVVHAKEPRRPLHEPPLYAGP